MLCPFTKIKETLSNVICNTVSDHLDMAVEQIINNINRYNFDMKIVLNLNFMLSHENIHPLIKNSIVNSQNIIDKHNIMFITELKKRIKLDTINLYIYDSVVTCHIIYNKCNIIV